MKANISWITETLATGGDLSLDPDEAREQYQELLGMDLALVIDVRQEANDEDLWEDTDTEYLHLPTDDAMGHHIPASLFNRAVREARFYIDAGEKVLVHCHMGINRGPSVAYAVLLDLDHDPVKAFDLIREKREAAAVLYAEDALEAELARRDFHHPVEIERLRHRMRQVWTPEEQGRIQRAIRENHVRDKIKAWKSGVMGLLPW